ncbi:MAG: hypothetical protein ACK56I_35130 [bacterium]
MASFQTSASLAQAPAPRPGSRPDPRPGALRPDQQLWHGSRPFSAEGGPALPSHATSCLHGSRYRYPLRRSRPASGEENRMESRYQNASLFGACGREPHGRHGRSGLPPDRPALALPADGHTASRPSCGDGGHQGYELARLPLKDRPHGGGCRPPWPARPVGRVNADGELRHPSNSRNSGSCATVSVLPL